MSKALTLEWSAGLIRLRALPHGEIVTTLAVPGATGASRIDLALTVVAELGPVLRVPSATREPFVRVVGDELEPLPRVPGEGHLATTSCRAHAAGLLTAIDGDRVWVWGWRTEWSARALPAGVIARDVSFAPDGTLWVAGSALRAGAQPAAVLLRLTEQGHEVVSLPLSGGERRLLADHGADEDYWRVDVEGTPGLVTASSASLDEPTDFVIVGWDAGWSVVTVDEEAVRTWARDGGLTLYRSGGRRRLASGPGKQPDVDDLRPAIRAAWPGGAPPGDPIIRAARPRGHELLLAVSIHDWKQPAPRHILASAVLHSSDDGRSFQPWAHTAGHDAELMDVLWL